jgi:PAS domain S-box-containing protein
MKPFDSWLARTHAVHGLVQVNFRQVALNTLLLGLSFAVLLGIPFVIHHRAESENNLRLLQKEQERVVKLAAGILQQEMDSVLSDLRYLSQHNELRNYLARSDRAHRLDLAKEYLGLVTQKRSYDQIRYIDLDGMEQVRVNFNDGRPEIVADEALQDKGHRYYFEEALWLSPGQIYVSPFDLNMEQGEVGSPPRPAIRFVLPVADEQGLVRGMVVLNYLGRRLLDKLVDLQGETGKVWLLNPQGYWLLGPRPEDEWSFMFPQQPQRNLAELSPELWQQLQAETSGVHQSATSRIVFERVYPLLGASSTAGSTNIARPVDAERYYWTVAVELAQPALEAANADLLNKLRSIYATLAIFGFVAAGALSFVGNRNQALSRATKKVLDNLPQLVAYVDKEQRYRFNNQAYERLFGQRPQDIYGKSLPELLGETAYRDIRAYVEQALSGKAVDFELQLAYQGAGLRDVVVSYLPDISAQGEVRGFFGIVNDVTPIKESERRERQRVTELAHVSRLASMGEMATEIAHEINQPLAAIAMYSAAGLRTLSGGGEQAKLEGWLEAINAQAKRASEIIRRLRRFLQKGETQQGPVDLNQIIREAAALLAHEAKSHDVTFELDLADDLPAIQGDRVLLQQVVFNLGRNAIDAVRDQAEEGRVRLSSSFDGQRVMVKVSDNGPGVDAALGENIFDSFITNKKDGLGMGLAISRSIVEAHAGSLRYTTNPGGGTTFMFSLEREANR